MKKKILGVAIVAAIALVSGWNISQSMSDSTLSDVALANVEALADESGGSSISWSCWSSLTSGAGVWLCGNPCSFHEDKGKGSGKDVCYSN